MASPLGEMDRKMGVESGGTEGRVPTAGKSVGDVPPEILLFHIEREIIIHCVNNAHFLFISPLARVFFAQLVVRLSIKMYALSSVNSHVVQCIFQAALTGLTSFRYRITSGTISTSLSGGSPTDGFR